jgi:hypothetical protein
MIRVRMDMSDALALPPRPNIWQQWTRKQNGVIAKGWAKGTRSEFCHGRSERLDDGATEGLNKHPVALTLINDTYCIAAASLKSVVSVRGSSC